MSENQNEEDLADLLNSPIVTGEHIMRATDNGVDMRQIAQDNQQLLTSAQRHALSDLETVLGLEPQGFSSQVLQDPSNSRTGQAGPSFSPLAPSNREEEHPDNNFPGQASSILPSSNIPEAEQAARNGLEPNLPNSGVSFALPQASLSNGSQATYGTLPIPLDITLEQAHLALQAAASRAPPATAPGAMPQLPQSSNGVQVSSGLQNASTQNAQYADMNRSVRNPQNLSRLSAPVNDSQPPNLDSRSLPHVSTPPCGQRGAAHDIRAELNVSDGVRIFPEDGYLSSPLVDLPQLENVHSLNDVQEGYLQPNDFFSDETIARIRNAIQNETNPVPLGDANDTQQHLSRAEARHDLMIRNSGPEIPMLSRGTNIQTGAMNQPETSALHHTLNAAVQLLNQSNDPILPQRLPEMNTNNAQDFPLSSAETNTQTGTIPQLEAYVNQNTNAESQLLAQLSAPILPSANFRVNNQTSVPHQPNTGEHRDEANPLPASQLPSPSNNQTRFESSPHIQAAQQTLDNADDQWVSLPEIDALSSSGSDVNAGGVENERELVPVSHSEQHSAALQWISDFIKDVSPPFPATLKELDSEESQTVLDAQDHIPGPSSQANQQKVPPDQHPISLEETHIPRFRKLLGSSYDKVSRGETDPRMKFSAHFTRMRCKNTCHDEISKAIAVPGLPLLDEEMDVKSKYIGSDTVQWGAEPHSSPTISRITSAIRQSRQGTVVLVETLFNHMFCLFRRSFLQREERVHLELTTLFLKNSRLDGEKMCENDAKELISWLERTFAPGHLAKLMQRLVIAIDDSPAMKFLVDRAKRKYNPRNTEMTVLGTFYELMNKQHDIMKASQDLAKRKQEADKSIREVKNDLASKNIKAPKSTYEKKKTRHNDQRTDMDHGLIRTFNATKWLFVECMDSHYAYSQSMLEAAKLTRNKTKDERDETLEILNGGISSLETRDDIADGIASLSEMKQSRKKVMERDISLVESTVLEGFVETMFALSKITVSALLRTVGKLPSRLALTLEAAGEELDKLRGLGSGEKPGVEDVVRIAHAVEKEEEKNATHRRIVLKKMSYIQECQQLLYDGVDAGGAPA